MDDAPSLSLDRVHLRGLRGIERLDLPEDGMGWAGRFPPVAMLGGENGSGKTTLLRCIVDAASSLIHVVDPTWDCTESAFDFSVSRPGEPKLRVRVLTGERRFVEEHLTECCIGRYLVDGRVFSVRKGLPDPILDPQRWWGYRKLPNVVFFPSEERDLVVPNDVELKRLDWSSDLGNLIQWARPSRDEPRGSLVERLYQARWEDLNAIAAGHAEQATCFSSFVKAFSDFTEGDKELAWTPKGRLVVRLRDGRIHNLEDLSAGERQAVLLLAELRRFWRPGSLILIDEPELHLHDTWQARLYETILNMQRELGGQVILATQSRSLFGMADEGTCALLGRRPLR